MCSCSTMISYCIRLDDRWLDVAFGRIRLFGFTISVAKEFMFAYGFESVSCRDSRLSHLRTRLAHLFMGIEGEY